MTTTDHTPIVAPPLSDRTAQVTLTGNDLDAIIGALGLAKRHTNHAVSANASALFDRFLLIDQQAMKDHATANDLDLAVEHGAF